MSSKTIRAILIFMLLLIGALFITQAYWFKKSFVLQERQFEEKLNIALRSVAHNLLILNEDSSTQIPPISKESSNEFYVKTNCYFSLATLDSLLVHEFSSRKIEINFDYLIVEPKSETILLGNTISPVTIGPVIACKKRGDNQEILDFKIRINNKTTYLLGAMGIWMYSSLSLLLVLALFTFIMVSIVKGKKLSILKKDFVNNMTHELKTPIANISVASDAIRNRNKEMDDEKLKKYANIIFNENERLHNLVDRVLEISSIEKKEESLSLEEIDLHSIINDIAGSFEALIHQRKGQLSLNLEASKFVLTADKIHVSNVIYNLIENAIKYSNTSPAITIKTSNNKNGIAIEIKDKGIGMNKENQERIFEKFYRAESGDLHNTKGFGLGLSYVKLIVEKHNGKINFTSNIGEGSTFTIFLPL